MFLICTNFNLKFRIKGITCEPSVFLNETHDNFGQSFRPKAMQERERKESDDLFTKG